MSTSVLIVLVTCPPAQAQTLARTLVEQRLAACVNVVPQLNSTYRWQGEVRQDDEALLIVKTAAARFDALRQTILVHHPYELPEIIAVNPSDGHAPYLDWILASTC